MKQAAFKAFAALGANEEDIRKQVITVLITVTVQDKNFQIYLLPDYCILMYCLGRTGTLTPLVNISSWQKILFGLWLLDLRGWLLKLHRWVWLIERMCCKQEWQLSLSFYLPSEILYPMCPRHTKLTVRGHTNAEYLNLWETRGFLWKSLTRFCQCKYVLLHLLFRWIGKTKLQTAQQVLSVRQLVFQLGGKCQSLSILDFTYTCTSCFHPWVGLQISLKLKNKSSLSIPLKEKWKIEHQSWTSV